ncbi:hypothetical protein CKAN_01350100 [Cinnamomum micranthum f. kanehirae]|uniref:Uncharacterized protein n=1 Tax=Cinnamomum micranthum f. kanehirae TaxID=337451 RepID=A0A3S3NC43_9MAGN|nr:hypothetical protein CKAN_01350100 [Cinnamomum micranthum f. kanehirae]
MGREDMKTGVGSREFVSYVSHSIREKCEGFICKLPYISYSVLIFSSVGGEDGAKGVGGGLPAEAVDKELVLDGSRLAMLRMASRMSGWQATASWKISRSCSVAKGSRILRASLGVSWEVDSKVAMPFSSASCFFEVRSMAVRGGGGGGY